MNPRALLLFSLLAAPAWAQEPAPVAPSHSFDLRDDAVRKIVRATAATQFGVVHVAPDETPAKAEPAPIKSEPAPVAYVPPVKTAPALQYPTRLPDPEPPSTGFLSSLIDTLLEDDDMTYAELHDEWLSCQSRNNVKTTAERAADCPALNSETRSVYGNPEDFKRVPAP
jgi:hypothetical protein